MDAESLTKLVPELERFAARFADCFADRRSRDHLPIYVRGQLSDLDRKSVEPIALKAGLAPRTLQEFLSLLSWDEARMRDRVQEIVATEHAGPRQLNGLPRQPDTGVETGVAADANAPRADAEAIRRQARETWRRLRAKQSETPAVERHGADHQNRDESRERAALPNAKGHDDDLAL